MFEPGALRVVVLHYPAGGNYPVRGVVGSQVSREHCLLYRQVDFPVSLLQVFVHDRTIEPLDELVFL